MGRGSKVVIIGKAEVVDVSVPLAAAVKGDAELSSFILLTCTLFVSVVLDVKLFKLSSLH